MTINEHITQILLIKQKLRDAKEAIERTEREFHFLYVELMQQARIEEPINSERHFGRD